MIVTEIYNGQGLGNQLFCYVTTRAIALDKGFQFGIQSPQKFKCSDFMDLDLGEKVIGGTGPEGGPPHTLPNGIEYYYNERKISHPDTGADIRTFDPQLVSVPDNTKIDGIMQDENYFKQYKAEIKKWLKIKPEYECRQYSSENICVINFRGGEYVYHHDLFLHKKYWDDAVQHMLKLNPELKFVVVTDDPKTAKKFFPAFEVNHFGIGKDYSIINNAQYLILSNSSFAWFPAWLNDKLKVCIAPKYWARHNTSDGLWSCSYNLTKGWLYLDKLGNLTDYRTCLKELKQVQKSNSHLFLEPKITENFLVVSNYYNDLSWVPSYTNNYLVYDQSGTDIFPPNLNKKRVIKSPHLGHNIRDYCTYIIDHYSKLPERVIFATGNVFPRHVSREHFNTVMNNTFFTPIEDMKRHQENWPISFFSSDGGFCEINNSWYLDLDGFHPTKFFHNYNDFLTFCFKDANIPRYIRFAPGANYIVTREQMLRYPKIFYENLRTFVSHSKRAIPGESHIIERAFHTVWSGKFEASEQMLKPIASDFKPVPKKVPSLTDKFVRQWIESRASFRRYLRTAKQLYRHRLAR